MLLSSLRPPLAGAPSPGIPAVLLSVEVSAPAVDPRLAPVPPVREPFVGSGVDGPVIEKADNSRLLVAVFADVVVEDFTTPVCWMPHLLSSNSCRDHPAGLLTILWCRYM
jgi:hypothetical protein